MLDRLTGMKVCSRVAALGTLSAAARALGMSQTMATKHVAAIEERLGVKLFNRTTRRVTPTEAGRRYLESCERILAEIEEAEEAAAAERAAPRGMLRVTVPVSFGIRQIAPALPEFARLYPGVSVDLGLSDRFVDLIEEGWDLAVRIGRLKDSYLVARRLAPCRTIVCAAPSYLAAKGVPRTVAELAGHNCLGYTLPDPQDAERWAFGRSGEIMVRVAGNLRASNGEALRAAAAAGQGLIYQPTFLVGSDIRAGRLVPVRLDQPTLDLLAVHAVRPPARHPPARVQAFVDFLAQRLAPDPPWDRDLPV